MYYTTPCQLCFLMIASLTFATPLYAGNGTERRAFSVDPAGGTGNIRAWPSGLIRYCTEKTVTDEFMRTTWVTAWGMWNQALLHSSLKPEPQGACTRELMERMRDVLRVSLWDEARSATTLGWQGPNNPTYLRFNPSSNSGMMNTNANLAHELGHVFGLFHEHQRPHAPVKFTCENLADYDKYKHSGHIEELCTNRAAALFQSFSASEFLSYAEFELGLTAGPEFDWHSIMLYPSTAGGKRLDGGRRAKVLIKEDGSEIQPNLTPSAQDIARVRLIYPPGGPPESGPPSDRPPP